VSGLGHLAAGTPAQKPLKYFGGESYTHTAGKNAIVYIGHEGVKASSPDALAALVLKNLIGGSGSGLKWAGDNTASRVGAEVAKHTASPFAVNGTAGIFSDGGLLGTFVTVANSDAAKAIPAAAKAINDVLAGNFSDEELARAKNQLRLAVLADDSASRLQDMSAQLLATGKYVTPEAAAEKVAAISAADIKALAKKVAGSKVTYSVFGNLDAVPYLDSLSL
jgi:ubiquinol-cytochrome c reductase core subunit 2